MNNNGQDSSVAEETSTGTGAPSGSAPQQPSGSTPQQPSGSAPQQPTGPARANLGGAAATGQAAAGTSTKQSGGNLGIWGPTDAGAGPKSDNLQPDPARVEADAKLVKECTAIVESFRQGRYNKSSAIAGLVYHFGLAKRHVATAIAPYVEQLDEHERACALAAAQTTANPHAGTTGTGAARGADAVSGSRDQLAAQSAPALKRQRATVDADPDAEEDDNDEDDVRPSKRTASGYDPDAAAFRVGLRPRFLSTLAQRTLSAQINYLADLKRAKRDLLATGCAPALPLELWDDVLANRAVDFDKIFTASFSHVIVDTTEHRLGGPDGLILHLPNMRPRKRVEDLADWLFCFHKWNEAVCAAFPFRRDELIIYLEFFTDLFNSIHKSHHTKVIQADTAIRNAASSDPSITLCDKERLHVLAMRHVSPYGADTSPVRSEPSGRRSSPASRPGRLAGPSRPGSSGEICKNYNRGVCQRDNCRHIHRCNRGGCNESHAAVDHEASQNSAGRGGGQRK